jgi:hypothetical protein
MCVVKSRPGAVSSRSPQAASMASVHDTEKRGVTA